MADMAQQRPGRPTPDHLIPGRLTLDHLTVVDATPLELVELAHHTGYQAVALFLNPVRIVPRLPRFDLYGDRAALHALKERLATFAIGLDAIYPVGLGADTDLGIFDRLLAAGAELGARYVNVLIYDPEKERQAGKLATFAERAETFGLGTALEFYPLSEVPSLQDGLRLVEAVNRPGRVGLTVDSLHLWRSGSSLSELRAVPPQWILFAQLADGPLVQPRSVWNTESLGDRLLPGEGEFDLSGFVASLPAGVPLSLEVPRDGAIDAGISKEARAQAARGSLRAL